MAIAAVPLYGYQKRWIADKHRFKAGRITRQGGKSFMLSLDSVLEGADTGVNEIILSAGERQSKEVIEKAKMHTEAMSIAASAIEEDFFADAQCKMLSIVLPNRARIIGLPANPATARGFTGNVRLDEFAFHKDSDKIWTALFPTISRGYKLSVVSTPQGKQNKFYNICTNTENGFSKHVVDIYQAIADGAPFNAEELKQGLDDEDAWQQEYMVQFLDEATAFLTFELIAGCETEGVPQEIKLEDFVASMLDWPVVGHVYIGVDIGRKKDLTIIYVLEKLGDVFYTRAAFTLFNVKFAAQEQFLWQIISRLKATRACIDCTGIGAQLAENTVTKFGMYRIEPVTFTNEVKNDLATRVLRTFQDRRIRIPISQTLRNDLHSIKKTMTAAGNIRFDAERTKDGHADRFWALSLALMASDEGAVPGCIII